MDTEKTLIALSEMVNEMEDLQKSFKELVERLESLQAKLAELESTHSLEAFPQIALKLAEELRVR